MINIQRIEKIHLDFSCCVHCGWCLSSCKTKALDYNFEKRILFKEELCIGCHLCIEICPRGAIRSFGLNSN
ncbi:MAG: ATP-binding protein [Promethearchaeota archaeon]